MEEDRAVEWTEESLRGDGEQRRPQLCTGGSPVLRNGCCRGTALDEEGHLRVRCAERYDQHGRAILHARYFALL